MDVYHIKDLPDDERQTILVGYGLYFRGEGDMKYRKDLPSQKMEHALGLEKHQVERLKNAIAKAYKEVPTTYGWNVDNINSIVAPYIKTPEEAFYAATVILTDVFGMMMQTGERPTNPN